MIIESGIIIFIGFILIAMKIPRKSLLWLLGFPLIIDLSASILAYAIHFGTFTGVMAAAVAGLMMSATISICRKIFGYIEPDKNGILTYYVGAWDLLPDIDYSDQVALLKIAGGSTSRHPLEGTAASVDQTRPQSTPGRSRIKDWVDSIPPIKQRLLDVLTSGEQSDTMAMSVESKTQSSKHQSREKRDINSRGSTSGFDVNP